MRVHTLQIVAGGSIALLSTLMNTRFCYSAERQTSTANPSDSSRILRSHPTVILGRSWTTRDIVEVARISDIAIRGATEVTAYILKQPSIADRENHFVLYAVDPEHAGLPRKLLEAKFLADLSWHPGTHNWTVRGDFGDGVQLYDVTEDGRTLVLLANAETPSVGGSEGLVGSTTDEPRATGVLSYEWAPDGAKFWYSRIRMRCEQQELLDQGLRYDDAKMFGATPYDAERAVRLSGTELHVVDQKTKSDRVIAFAPADAAGDFEVFRRKAGSAAWVDSSHIQFRMRGSSSGYLRFSLWRCDVLGREMVRFKVQSPEQIYYSIPMGTGALTVKSVGSVHRLVNIGFDGRVVTDYGSVAFARIGGGHGAWHDEHSDRLVFSVSFSDHDGLVTFSSKSRSTVLPTNEDHLGVCAFNQDLSFGACSRENLSLAPELVSVNQITGKMAILARPNAQYDAIAPLLTVVAHWVNRYGSSNTGYVTYPRHYRTGKAYPAIVVSHSRDARNRFAEDAFQWEFPIQVFAERGYFVLSVNEPIDDDDVPPPYNPGAPGVGVAREQFKEAYNPLASMEAAADALVKNGSVQPSKIGIAGYSRGSTIARFAISHSSMFSVASSADATWWDVGGFWAGSTLSRNLYKNLLGGTPFDPAAYPNYLAFAPSARARSFAGPLLQQFTLAGAKEAVEMDQLLKDAHIPTELIFYPSESHIFWQPRHRAAAMAQNLDWFDYWLVGRRDSDPQKKAQYSRWDDMAAEWRALIAQRQHKPRP